MEQGAKGMTILQGYKPVKTCPNCGGRMRVDTVNEVARCEDGCGHSQGGAAAWE